MPYVMRAIVLFSLTSFSTASCAIDRKGDQEDGAEVISAEATWRADAAGDTNVGEPHSLVVSPDCAVWFLSRGHNRIERLGCDGTRLEPVPSSSSQNGALEHSELMAWSADTVALWDRFGERLLLFDRTGNLSRPETLRVDPERLGFVRSFFPRKIGIIGWTESYPARGRSVAGETHHHLWRFVNGVPVDSVRLPFGSSYLELRGPSWSAVFSGPAPSQTFVLDADSSLIILSSASRFVYAVDSALKVRHITELSEFEPAVVPWSAVAAYRDSLVGALKYRLSDSLLKRHAVVNYDALISVLDSAAAPILYPFFQNALLDQEGHLWLYVANRKESLWREYDLSTGRVLGFMDVPHVGRVVDATFRDDEITTLEATVEGRFVIGRYRPR